jgi:proteasome component ECM29
VNLASHQSIWNSKRGAVFAAVELGDEVKAALEPVLPSVIPKIYRSTFDPNPKIASSMSQILKVRRRTQRAFHLILMTSTTDID